MSTSFQFTEVCFVLSHRWWFHDAQDIQSLLGRVQGVVQGVAIDWAMDSFGVEIFWSTWYTKCCLFHDAYGRPHQGMVHQSNFSLPWFSPAVQAEYHTMLRTNCPCSSKTQYMEQCFGISSPSPMVLFYFGSSRTIWNKRLHWRWLSWRKPDIARRARPEVLILRRLV